LDVRQDLLELSFRVSFPEDPLGLGAPTERVGVVDTGDELGAGAGDLREVAEAFADTALVLLFWAIFLDEDFLEEGDVFADRFASGCFFGHHFCEAILDPVL
jgi:hypothetical protein